MVDWDAGSYERTAAELEPVAEAVVARAAPQPGEAVLDLACGTGNAALLAARGGARVAGIDAAPRLLDVARERARAQGLDVEFRHGDLHDLPLGDRAVDVVVSIFGVIFAADPVRALGEVARVLRPSGRAYVTAWVPAGPIDAMLGAHARVLRRITGAPPPDRVAWSDPGAVGRFAAAAGLTLRATAPAELAIRAASPEAYVAAGVEHPMAIAARPALAGAGAEEEARAAMLAVLGDANEEPTGFLVHSPYVVHELRPA